VQGEYGPQVKLRGNFNGDAQGTVYINEACEWQMRTLGVLADGPSGGLVISRAVPITVLRTEENGKKRTNLSLASGGAAAPAPVNHAPTNGHAAAPAHTLFIAADRRNCLSPLPPKPVGPITDAQKAEIDTVSEQLATRHAWTRERLSSEILGATQAPELGKLTEPQAKIAIDFLQRKLRDMD